MPLQRGKVLGYDFNRMVVDFTMFNQGKTVRCAISTAAMDDLEGKHDVRADQRVDQFVRLRDAIEERASRKFFEGPVEAKGPVVLRSNDFFKSPPRPPLSPSRPQCFSNRNSFRAIGARAHHPDYFRATLRDVEFDRGGLTVSGRDGFDSGPRDVHRRAPVVLCFFSQSSIFRHTAAIASSRVPLNLISVAFAFLG